MSSAQTVSAKTEDRVNWRNDFIIYTDYNSSTSKLDVQIKIDVPGKTLYDYTISFPAGGTSCNTDMTYKSLYAQLIADCTLTIPESKMQ